MRLLLLCLAVALAVVGFFIHAHYIELLAERAEFARYAEQLLNAAYDNGNAPGAAVLVARGDEVLYRGAIGLDDIVTDERLSADGVFRIGSLTKQFSAAAVLKLAEDGKLMLDDPLIKFLPNYPGGHEITLRQLLNHTSGVVSYSKPPGMMNGDLHRDVTTTQLIDSFRNEKPEFAPGGAWTYNNTGYVLVGAVIEAASGMPWNEYLATVFFEPLGLEHTGHGHDPEVVKTQVRGWSLDGPRPVPPRMLSMTQPHAAGALVSSVDDLHRWNRALHEGHVLTPESYALMTTPTGKAVEAHYGFGLIAGSVRGRASLSHGGHINGFLATLHYLPGPDISVVVLQNADNVRPRQMVPEAIARRLAAVALGDPYPVPEPIEIEPSALHAFEGLYRVDDMATRSLRVVEGQITSRRTGGKRSVLVPIAPDEFLFDDGFSRLAFERDAAGKVIGMRFFEWGEGAGQYAPRISDALPAARQ